MFCIHFIMNIPPSGRLSILSKLQKFLPEHQSYTVNIFTLESLQQAIKEEAGVPPAPLTNITIKNYLLREGVKKILFFLGLCPKHRTPPTHRTRLGLH